MSPRAAALRWLVLGGALVGLYVAAVRTSTGQKVDGGAFTSVAGLHERYGAVAGGLRTGLPLLAAVGVVGLGVVALRQGRGRPIAGALLALLAVPAARLLRETLDRPYLGDNGYLHNTFPSGHAAALGAVLLAAQLLVPPARRRTGTTLALTLVAAAGAFANVVSYAHRPSDVAGGLLLAGVAGVAGAVVAGEGASSAARSSTTVRSCVLVATLAVTSAALLGGDALGVPTAGADAVALLGQVSGVLAASAAMFLAVEVPSGDGADRRGGRRAPAARRRRPAPRSPRP